MVVAQVDRDRRLQVQLRVLLQVVVVAAQVDLDRRLQVQLRVLLQVAVVVAQVDLDRRLQALLQVLRTLSFVRSPRRPRAACRLCSIRESFRFLPVPTLQTSSVVPNAPASTCASVPLGA